MSMSQDHSIKNGEFATFNVLLVGDSSVGKSSIARRIIDGQFDDYYLPTIGVMSWSKMIPEHNIKLEIHDFSGEEKYNTVIPIFTQKTNCIIFVFDLSRPETFSRFQSYWLNYLQKDVDQTQEKMLAVCGCKSDQAKPINNQLLQELKQEDSYFEVSAIEGNSIEKMFSQLYEKWEKGQQSQYKASLQWKIRMLQSQRQQINKRLKSNKQQIRTVLKKNYELLNWLKTRKNAKGIRDYKIRNQILARENDLNQIDAAFAEKNQLLGTLDTLTYNLQVLVRQYEADSLKMRERLAQKDNLWETISQLQERCNKLQGICDQLEGNTLKNLPQLLNKATAAYQSYKKQYIWFKASIIQHREDSFSTTSNILQGINHLLQ